MLDSSNKVSAAELFSKGAPVITVEEACSICICIFLCLAATFSASVSLGLPLRFPAGKVILSQLCDIELYKKSFFSLYGCINNCK